MSARRTVDRWAKAIHPGIEVEGQTRNGHWKLALPNGRTLQVAHSPSDHRTRLNERSRIRRALRE